MDGTIAVIGTGRMGEAVVAGLLRADVVSATQIVCTARRDERVAELEATYGVRATTDNRQAALEAETLVVALKPQVLPGELARLAPALGGKLVVSLAAGTTTAAIEQAVGHGVAVVRAMPNTPMLVDRGMTALCRGQAATEQHLALTETLFSSVGRVVRVDEALFDAVTAVSGSGPAYVFFLAESMMDAAQAEGLSEDVARLLVVQTLLGASAMLDADPDPVRLRAQVTSPGGTTEAAVAALDDGDFRGVVAAAVQAARQRGAQLGGRDSWPRLG